MKQIIHVNQHNIRHNIKNKDRKPVLSTKTHKDNRYGNVAILRDKKGTELGRFIYSPDKPLSCGARVWFESDTNTLDIEVVE